MFRILPLILLTVVMLTGCIQPESQTSANNTPAIGVVDTSRVFRESAHGQKAVKILEDMQGDMQKELTALQEEVQKDAENVEAQQRLQSTYMAFQQRMGAEEQNIINILNEVMQRTINDYRAEKKLLIIVPTDTIIAYDKTIDITQDIITAINKAEVEFTSIAPLEETVTPESDNTQETEADNTTESDDTTQPAAE